MTMAREKRVRTNLLRVWLSDKEYGFLDQFAEENSLTISELIRTWIHQSMKQEGVLKDVSLKEIKPKTKGN